MEVINKRLFEIEKTSFALLNLFQEMSIAMEAGFDRISGRINKLELQLTNIETRIDQLEMKMVRLETRMENLETRIDQLEMKMVRLETRMENLETRIDQLEMRMVRLETRMGNLETRTGNLETMVTNLGIQIIDLRNDLTGQINAIRGNSTASLETIEIRLADLTKELMKVNEVTSYEGIYENTMRINEGMKSKSAGKRK